ncbi:hypothetical protein R6Q59_011336 [Mikania micrantha]
MFPNLQSLDLSFNKLTRSIPNSFQDSQSLHFLYLGSNMLTGEIPSNIITPQLRALLAPKSCFQSPYLFHIFICFY